MLIALWHFSVFLTATDIVTKNINPSDIIQHDVCLLCPLDQLNTIP